MIHIGHLERVTLVRPRNLQETSTGIATSHCIHLGDDKPIIVAEYMHQDEYIKLVVTHNYAKRHYN